MGCFWSSEDQPHRCFYCGRKAVNNLIVVDNVCEICTSVAAKRNAQNSQNTHLRPCFGEYRCSCGRFWSSRLSWAGTYQICRRCRKHVYPFAQRDLRPGDHTQDKNESQEHKKELCQMCQQLGYYCGDYEKRNRPSGNRYKQSNRGKRY